MEGMLLLVSVVLMKSLGKNPEQFAVKIYNKNKQNEGDTRHFK